LIEHRDIIGRELGQARDKRLTLPRRWGVAGVMISKEPLASWKVLQRAS